MPKAEFVYVKSRISTEHHAKLKEIAKRETRSMNFLINKAVELLIRQQEKQ